MPTLIVYINNKKYSFTRHLQHIMIAYTGIILLLLLIGSLFHMPMANAAVDPTGYLRYQIWYSNNYCKIDCFKQNEDRIPIDGDSANMDFDGITNKPNIDKINATKPTARKRYIDVRYSGSITIKKSGVYSFSLKDITDNARIYVDGKLVTEVTQITPDEYTNDTTLEAGTYPFEIWLHSYSSPKLTARYKGPDTNNITQCIICDPEDVIPEAFSAAKSELPHYQGMDFTGDNILPSTVYYNSYFHRIRQFDLAENKSTEDFQPSTLPIKGKGMTSDPSINTLWDFTDRPANNGNPDSFIILFYAYLRVNQTGTYTFDFTSNELAGLYIDGYPVFVNNHLSGDYTDNTIKLTAGIHKVVFAYYEDTGISRLGVNYTGPDTGDVPEILLLDRETSADKKPVINEKLFIIQNDSSNDISAQVAVVDPFSGKGCPADAMRRYASFANYPEPSYNNKGANTAQRIPYSAIYNNPDSTYGIVNGLNYTGTGNQLYGTNFQGFFKAIRLDTGVNNTLRLTWHQNIKQAGNYTFNIDYSYGLVWIIIDGVTQLYTEYQTKVSKSIPLTQGSHRIEVLYADRSSDKKLAITWSGPDTDNEIQRLLFNENSFSDRLCDPIDSARSSFTASSRTLANGAEQANLSAILRTRQGKQITWTGEKFQFVTKTDTNQSLVMSSLTSPVAGQYNSSMTNTDSEIIQTNAQLTRNKRVGVGKDSTLVFSSGADVPDTETINIGGSPKTTDFYKQHSNNELTGYVYQDRNLNAQFDTGDKGIPFVSVVLQDINNSSCVSTKTKANGQYLFTQIPSGTYVIYEAANETIPIPNVCNYQLARDPDGYYSTTPNSSSAIQVPNSVETNFGNMTTEGVGSALAFVPSNNSVVIAGSSDTYWHQLTVSITGTIDLSIDVEGVNDWNNQLFIDDDCNGIIQNEELNPFLGRIIVTEQSTFCLAHYVSIPSNAVDGEMQIATITADFTFGDGTTDIPNLQRSITNSTISKAPNGLSQELGRLTLRKYVKNLTANTPETQTINQAKPEDILQYRIEYTNYGNANIVDLTINDAIPEYTTPYNDPKCLDTPVTLVTCNASISNNDISWIFTGELTPAAIGSVSYQVKVE